jgi:hypothetical protein
VGDWLTASAPELIDTLKATLAIFFFFFLANYLDQAPGLPYFFILRETSLWEAIKPFVSF